MDVLALKIKDLLGYNKENFIKYLNQYILSYGLPVEESQIVAWRNCYDFLVERFKNIDEKFYDTFVVFEYMLPLEKYRRPDVILLFDDRVIILEFKDKNEVLINDVEQCIGYREDIKNYHYITEKMNLQVECYLVLTKSNESKATCLGVDILNKDNFNDKVFDRSYFPLNINKVEEWLKSKYEPIPSIIEAAHKLFFEGELPYIKNIADGDIEVAVDKVWSLIRDNETVDKKKRIIFVSGVPGSGKTLVALKTLYEYNRQKYEEEHESFAAVYLSGNGPLVNVLREELSGSTVNGVEGKAYIRGMLEFKKEFMYTDKNIPQNTVLMFDEAQRAWDKEHMKKPYSEAEGLLKIGHRIFEQKGYVTIICFVGDGQSIHLGEEKGISLWVDVLKKYKDWDVYIPSNYKDVFEELNAQQINDNTVHLKDDDAKLKCINICSELYLDTSIRNNFIDTSKWIEGLLNLDVSNWQEYIKSMKSIVKEMMGKGLILRITRDMKKVIWQTNQFKKENPKAKYGFIVSSKCRDVEKEIKKYTNNYYTTSYIRDIDAGKWFMYECVNFKKAASEFLCQGLEIDFPVVLFGGDYYIKDKKWTIRPCVIESNKGKYKDFDTIIQNIYRVLLSRSRKGMILFLPSSAGFDETYNFFRDIGIPEI